VKEAPAMRSLALCALAAAGVAISACTGVPQNSLGPAPSILPPAGSSQVFRAGFTDGCNSGYADAGRDGFDFTYTRSNVQYDAGGEYADGCSSLGTLYEAGTGVPQDLARATSLYREACDGDGAVGCFKLAQLHFSGTGVAQDFAQADTLYDRACDRGHAEGCFKRGEMYANGTGVDRLPWRADREFRRACRLGYQEACRRQ